MESDRFDALARSVASRRSLLARLGGGGAGALALGALGLRVETATAATACLLDFRLFVRVGPSAGFPLTPTETKTGQLAGQLRLAISNGGDLANSSFALANGTSFPVVGSVNGHQLAARVALDGGRTLVLQGVGDRTMRACQGAYDGGLVGPAEGDLGDWHAVAAPSPATPTPAATATTASAAGGTTGGGQPVEQPTAPALAPTSTTAAPTPAETATMVACGICQSQLGLPNGPKCPPLPDGTNCGAGLVCCGGACVDPASNRANCGACGHRCAAIMTCVSGACQSPVAAPTVGGIQECGGSLTNCGGNCVDLTSDGLNCGSCGEMCGADGAGQPLACVGGQCTCPVGQMGCGGVCGDLSNNPNHCGSCDNLCISGCCRNSACC